MRCLCILILVSCKALCQEIDLSRISDDLAPYIGDEENAEDVYENYAQLLNNPIDLNRASADDLRFLNVLSESQIQNLLEYRRENGNMMHILELQAVEGLDYSTIEKILPYIKIPTDVAADKSLFQKAFGGGTTYLVTRVERTIETSEGYVTEDDSKKFDGSPEKIYTRFRSSRFNQYSIGFTAEKDAGEKIIWQPQRQRFFADYFSYHLQLSNKKFIKNFIIGDFQAQFGHGLILGSAFGLGKGGETISTIRKPSLGFVPYTSANESGFLRGCATTFQVKNIFISAFGSKISRDASLSEAGETSITSFPTAGLHRNANEMITRKTAHVSDYGVAANYISRNVNSGILIHHSEYEFPVDKRDLVYNQFAFEGKYNTNFGAWANYTVSNFNFFTEVARTLNQGAAFLTGVLTTLTPKTDVALLLRSYDRDYQSPYGNAFSENTAPQNEQGLYWGWKHRFNRKYTIAGYIDMFKFPWLKFRVYRPSQGSEILFRFNYQPSRKTTVTLQVRQEDKERNASNDQHNGYTILAGKKRNALIAADYTLQENLRMRTRVQLSDYSISGKRSTGSAFAHDIMFKISKLKFSARYALFDTEDFDNRQYMFENDVWLAYSLPAYYGTGTRTYLMAEYKPVKNFTVWLRYGHWVYENKTEIGSGEDMIPGNKKNDIKLQVRIQI